MPKSKQRRKKPKRSVPWYEKKFNVEDIAKTAWKWGKKALSLINTEMHLKDTDFNSVTPDTTGTVTLLTDIDQGDNYEHRQGLKIKLVNVAGRFIVTQNASATQSALRIICFQDRLQVGTAPTVTDVLENVSVTSFYEHSTFGRYRVLYDDVFTFTSLVKRQKIINFFFKFPEQSNDSHCQWTDGTGTNTHRGNLYLLLLSNEATNTPDVDGTTRVRYIDN